MELPEFPYPGELLPLERAKLHNWVLELQPRVILEVGFGSGASTFFMAQALRKAQGECEERPDLAGWYEK